MQFLAMKWSFAIKKVVKDNFQLNEDLLKHLIPGHGYSPYYHL